VTSLDEFYQMVHPDFIELGTTEDIKQLQQKVGETIFTAVFEKLFDQIEGLTKDD
jgi:hypothetical protein